MILFHPGGREGGRLDVLLPKIQIMGQLGEIMERIRDIPVCPISGEVNLYCIIQKHIEDERISKILRRRDFIRGRD